MWDHWDAVYDDYEVFGGGQPAPAQEPRAPQPEAAVIHPETRTLKPLEEPETSDRAYYWVGFGGVLAGLAVYFLAAETYRLFGVILAAYGSLTIAGKGVWSLMQRRPRSQG